MATRPARQPGAAAVRGTHGCARCLAGRARYGHGVPGRGAHAAARADPCSACAPPGILNPGADDPSVVAALEAAGVRVQLDCTLILLDTEPSTPREHRRTVRTAARALIIESDASLSNTGARAPYLLPGGGQRHEETLVACVRREVREELEVDIEVGRLRYVREFSSDHPDSHLGAGFHRARSRVRGAARGRIASPVLLRRTRSSAACAGCPSRRSGAASAPPPCERTWSRTVVKWPTGASL